MSNSQIVTGSAYEPTQCLVQIEDRESKRNLLSGEKNPAITFMKDVKNSLLFQYDWARMLSAAPLSLSLMGYCYLAASSSNSTISLKDAAPADGFKYLRYPTLKASLIQVSDTGRLAFITAEAKMSMLSSTSASLSQLMNQIVECISSLPHPAAALSLQSKLSFLKSSSDDCCQYAKDTEKGFADWLKLVMELHQVSVYKGELTNNEEGSNIERIAEEELSLKLTKETEKRALEVAEMMKQDLEMAKSAFKKAADDCPGPWESLAISTVDALAKGITTGVSQIFHRIMHPPIPKFLRGGKRSKGCASDSNDLPKGAEVVGNVNIDDPAFAQAGHISTLVSGLVALLTSGDKGGVDWESIADTGKNKKNGLTYLLKSLDHKKKHSSLTGGDASIKLKGVIDDAINILNEVKEIANKQGEISFEKPTADSSKVQDWQTKVKEIKNTVVALQSTAASIPGNSNNISAKAKILNPTLLNPSRSAVNATLAHVTERLKITELAYMNTQQSYNQANQQLNGIQADLGKVQKELTKLNLQKATLADIKSILIQCMGVLIDLKSQISELVRFFTAISCMVDSVIKIHVTSFMLEANVAKDSMMNFGGISLADFQRQSIYSTCLMVRAYFSLIQTVANMYIQVSKEYIMTGLRMCDELSKATINNQPQNVIIERNKVLEDYSAEVQTKLCKMVKEKQEVVSSQLQKRAEIIAAEIKYIPKQLVTQSQAAITEGSKDAAEMNAQAIENHGSVAVEAGKLEFITEICDDDI